MGSSAWWRELRGVERAALLSAILGVALGVAWSRTPEWVLARGDPLQACQIAAMQDGRDAWGEAFLSQGDLLAPRGRILHSSGPDRVRGTRDDLEVEQAWRGSPWPTHLLSIPPFAWLLLPLGLAWISLWSRLEVSPSPRLEAQRAGAMGCGPALLGLLALWWLHVEENAWHRPWHDLLHEPPGWLLLPVPAWVFAGAGCLFLPFLFCFWLRTRRLPEPKPQPDRAHPPLDLMT